MTRCPLTHAMRRSWDRLTQLLDAIPDSNDDFLFF
jgi:hypothetical protein